MTPIQPASKEERDKFLAQHRAKQAASVPTPTRKKPPSLFQKAKSLGGAVVRHVMAGLPKATPDMIQSRLAICMKCPNYTPRDPKTAFDTLRHLPVVANCAECGCYIHSANIQPNKLALPMEKCPLPEPKWGPVRP